MAQHVSLMIPMQVLADIDNSRNPMQLTRERLERAATENQFMNGKIAAIHVRMIKPPLDIGALSFFFFHQSYRKYLDEAIVQNFPELEPYLKENGNAIGTISTVQ